MPGFDTLFTTVESYENMTIFYLQVSPYSRLLQGTIRWQPGIGYGGASPQRHPIFQR